MSFIEALEGGITAFGKADKMLETAISKLFFFGGQVVKVYKRDRYYFANLLDLEQRKKFFEDDFFWNHTCSPDIYKKLGGVRTGAGFELVDFLRGDDFYILMKRIDDTQTITKLMSERAIAPADMGTITGVLTNLLRTLTREKKNDYRHLIGMGWERLWKEDTTNSLRPWFEMVEEYIPKHEADGVMTILETASSNEPYLRSYNPDLLAVVIDNNCDNLLFLGGKPAFIDIMPPKEGWRIADEFSTIVRTAVDAYVIGGKEYGDAVYDTYRRYRDDAPERVKLIYETRAAFIQWPYRHMIRQHDEAERFRAFALTRIETLAKS